MADTFNGSFEAKTEDGLWGSSWGVSSESNDLISSVTEGVPAAGQEVVDTFNGLGKDIDTTVSLAENIFTDGSQYTEVWDALSSAATKYKEDMIERIKSLWTTPATITIGSIMEEVAPYALNTSDAVKLLVKKLLNFSTYLTGITSFSDDSGSWWQSLENMGVEIGSDILGDSAVTDSLSKLSVIQSFASGVQTVVNVIDGVQSTLKKVEPLIPYIEILCEFSLGCEFRIGPVTKFQSITKGAQDTVANASKLAERLIAQSIYDLKKYLYSVKLTVPSLVVGSLQSLSVKEALVGYEGLDGQLNISNVLFGDVFYLNTANSLTVARAIDASLNSLRNTVTAPPLRSAFKTSDFLAAFVINYMDSVIADARRGLKKDLPPYILCRMPLGSDNTEDNQYVEYKEGAPYAAKEISYYDKDKADLPEASIGIIMQYQYTSVNSTNSISDRSWLDTCPVPTRQAPYLWIRYKYSLSDGVSTKYSDPYMICSYKTDARRITAINVFTQALAFTDSYASSGERQNAMAEILNKQEGTSLWQNATAGKANLGNGTGHKNNVSLWAYVETTYVNSGMSSNEALQKFLENQLRPDQLLPDTIRTISYSIYEGIV